MKRPIALASLATFGKCYPLPAPDCFHLTSGSLVAQRVIQHRRWRFLDLGEYLLWCLFWAHRSSPQRHLRLDLAQSEFFTMTVRMKLACALELVKGNT
jgi:hypothetical protein